MPDIQKSILTVDDNATNLTVLNDILSRQYKVFQANSGERALKFLEKRKPDLVLLDVEMPLMSGYEVLDAMKACPAWADIPVIFLTGKEDPEYQARAFELGAVDYIQKPINKTILLSRAKLHLEVEQYKKNLEHLVEVKTAQVLAMQETTLNLLATVTEYRDKDTGNHVRRVSEYVGCIMQKLFDTDRPTYRIDKCFYDNLTRLAPLHDIGKVGIPDNILLKPDKLSPDEFEVMKTHAQAGAELLIYAMKDGDDYDFLLFAHDIVIAHHEKWNGTGYPKGLSGEDIPLSGRIMAIADVYDALTMERPYKPPFSHEVAIQIMSELRATHFDPYLLDIFLENEAGVLSAKERYNGGQ